MKSFIIYLSILATVITGCEKSELLRYESGNDLYLNYVSDNYATYDTANVMYARRKTAVSDSVVILVNLIGKLPTNSIPFRLEADKSLTTAVEGLHYTMPVADSLFMKAGERVRRVVIYTARPAELRENEVTLFLRLMPNQYFNNAMTVYNYSSSPVTSAITLRITINDILYKPDLWEANEASLGTYSREKLELLVSRLLLNINNFYSAFPYSSSALFNYSRTLQQYLNAQKAQGNIIREKDGTEMKMGPTAQ